MEYAIKLIMFIILGIVIVFIISMVISLLSKPDWNNELTYTRFINEEFII